MRARHRRELPVHEAMARYFGIRSVEPRAILDPRQKWVFPLGTKLTPQNASNRAVLLGVVMPFFVPKPVLQVEAAARQNLGECRLDQRPRLLTIVKRAVGGRLLRLNNRRRGSKVKNLLADRLGPRLGEFARLHPEACEHRPVVPRRATLSS